MKHCFVGLLALSWSLASPAANGQDTSDNAAKLIQGVVTDRENQPIEGAQVAWMNWFSRDEKGPVAAVTNDKGVFELEKSKAESNQYVVIHKPGYAVAALNMNWLPARARVWPMKPVALRIVDQKQNPVANAVVTLASVHFQDEHLISNVPASLSKPTQAVSREDGWAILRSTRPTDVGSIAVTVDGYGSQTFAADLSKERFHILQLWETTSIDVTLTLDGEPAVDWIVAVASDGNNFGAGNNNAAANNPINKNILPVGVEFQGKSDSSGKLTIPHALLRRPIVIYVIDPKKKLRDTQTIVPDGSPESSSIDMTIRPPAGQAGQALTGHVTNTDTNEPIPGISITLANYESAPYDQIEVVADEQGQISVSLTPGTWNWNIPKSPAGQVINMTSENRFVVTKGDTKLPKLKASVYKAKAIRGTIQDVDLAIRRARWIHVDWTSPTGASGNQRGTFNPDGTFAVDIPSNAVADSYKIVAVGGGSDPLRVVSKIPLVLTSDAAAENAEN
ncbi:hypothetical protein [Planctomycetes bacterium K23_9]|uniref:Nickel uptake substrate-specific transmembrane region n=1 Tax=Stieleria marina TaxID=1930275 RepID=A0A517NSN6_9BACT|nr:Nickel uptake substrate-specific transmembrane region [Planctomycetes bacterium K23_9]